MCKHIHLFRVDTGLTPGRKKAYQQYKAALKESLTRLGADAEAATIAPHTYMLALDDLPIQTVCIYNST